VFGRHGTRNTPSLLDVGRQRSLFWDGRRTRLEDQALDPLLGSTGS
jgi:cytochrome c peroxidase